MQISQQTRMHSMTVGKHKINASHEDVTVHNGNARMKQSESWETDTLNCSTKSTVYSNCCKDMSSMYHGTWPLDRNIWDAESPVLLKMEVSSIMSFASSSGGVPLDQLLSTPDQSRRSSQQLEAKVDMVYSLLSMLGGQEQSDMGETLLALSISPESCLAMRQSGCLPLLVQLVQSDRDSETRKKAAQALHNLVESQPDEKARKREIKILGLLEIVTSYTDALENNSEFTCDMLPPDGDKHPVQIVSQIMKSSFDEGYRQAICQLGGIHSIAKLVEMEHFLHGSVTEETNCNLLRRYGCMVLMNLTFGDSGNKALLCSYKDFIRSLLVQLQSPNDELRQVTAGVLRNLSWRADSTSKEILKEVGSVKSLMQAAMLDNKENTLISILSALWNLSAHCTENKSEICSVDGALVFLIRMLSYKPSSETSAIVENCGGILRNISSQIAVRDDYRNILRKYNCLEILVNHLKSTSSTIVSNACGTLWNLSSQNATDQELLWTLGAPSLLKNLTKSKHKMIAMGSSASLKNLLSAKADQALPQLESVQFLEVKKQTNENLLEAIDVDLPLDLSRKRPDIEFIEESQDSKSLPSANLNMNESTSSFMNEKESQILLNNNSTSLPYVNSTKSGNSLTCIPVRNKYSDNFEDELESSEEPFDFSRKYSETRSRDNTQKKKSSNTTTSYDYEKPENENFSIYAETDLDQPTDYSLRYAENDTDSDSEVCENAEKTPAEFVGDTIKTYCTEGTPYETPFNFSTSTSMSDLRMGDKNTSENDKNVVNKSETKEAQSVEVHCVAVQNSVTETQPKASKIKSELSSGLMSPEKPMNYCDEGTPGYFSRVSSFGSLNSSPVCQSENKVSEEIRKENSAAVSSKIDKIQPKVSNNEVKVVKFENNVNYCEETPLMFSRSSSLGSLDSIEQHSIHDDRSSVISDFSRLTSGIISPSELPDSPSQTIPPSPKPQNTSEFPIVHRASSEGRSRSSPGNILPKSHVFEDKTTKFKEESTPIQYSMATSLSSLTIDDQDEGQIRSSVEDNEKEDNSMKQYSRIEENENVTQEVSDNPELYRSIGRTSIPRKTRRQLDLTSTSRDCTSSFQKPSNSSLYKNSSTSLLTLSAKKLPPPLSVDNTVQTYCTEDTPAVLSHNGSISDLSTLSMLDEEPVENKVYLSENSSQSFEMHHYVQKRQSEEIEPDVVSSKKDHTDNSISKQAARDIKIPQYTTAVDEVSFFAVEDSPVQFSEMSSLSNLTIGSSMTSEVKEFNFSLSEHTIPEQGARKYHVESFLMDDTEPCIANDNISEIGTRLEKTYSESKQESKASLSSSNYDEVKENYSNDKKGARSIFHSTEEENPKMLGQDFVNLELRSGVISSDSLKKRKWKWKWKFGSDGDEQSYFKENISSIENPSIKKEILSTVIKNEEITQENSLSMLGLRSLDASCKKKKWWKWKFGVKEVEQGQTIATDVPKCEHLDIVPQKKWSTIQSDKSDSSDNKESLNTALFARKEDILFKSDIYRDDRNKSRRWKWKWKFNSKESENSKSEELIMGLSKLKHSVSPVRKKETYNIESLSEQASIKDQKELHSLSVKLSSGRFSRSASEPCSRKKSSEEETQEEEGSRKSCSIDSVQVEQTGEALELNANNPDDMIIPSNFKETSDSQRLDPVQIDDSCPEDKCKLVYSTSENNSFETESAISGRVCPRKPDFVALIEECIQLGMPRKYEIIEKPIIGTRESMAAQVIRNMSEKSFTSSNSLKSDDMSKNDLEFLRRQLNIADKHLLQEAMEKGISKEEEAFLVELLIMKRLITEARQSGKQIQNYMAGLNSCSSKFSGSSKSDCTINKLISYSEEPLDPVTLSIVKRILHYRFQREYENNHDFPESKEKYNTDSLEKGSSGNSNFQIVLEERIKVSVAKHEAVENKLVCSNSEESTSASRTFIQDSSLTYMAKDIIPNTNKDYTPEHYLFQNSYDQFETSTVEERGSPAEMIKSEDLNTWMKTKTPNLTQHDNFIAGQIRNNIHICDKDDQGQPEKCTQYELLHKREPEQTSVNISENISKNQTSTNTRRDYAALVEECIQLGMPKKKSLSEETIYANISQVPGYSRCYSSKKHETSSLISSGPNVNTASKVPITDTGTTEAEPLVEKCIKMGMKKKNETFSTNALHKEKSCTEISKVPSSSQLNKKPDYKSLLEECIQLGMPKKKEVFPEARSSSPKTSTFPTNLTRSQSVKGREQNHITLAGENYTEADSLKAKEDPEEAIYANISITAGYTRLLPTNAKESRKIKKGECDEQQDYSVLINECIKLGMPSRKKNASNIVEGKYNSSKISCNSTPNYEALIEECIQLGMPKKKDISDAIYVNTIESFNTSSKIDSGFTRSLPKRMLRSESEPGSKNIPFDHSGNSRSVSALPPYYSPMDRALEECIQLGWPKKNEIVTDRKTTELPVINDPSKILPIGRTKDPESKNVDVASVARSTPEYPSTCFRTLTMVTGAEDEPKLPDAVRMTEPPDVEEMRLVDQGKNGYEYTQLEYPMQWVTEFIELNNETEDGSEMSFAGLADVDAKLLDPEAMLKALDKYTAKLISQAEFLKSKRSYKPKQEIYEVNT